MSTLEKHLTLSLAQERLWFLDQLEIGSPVYTISATYYLHGHLNNTALTESLHYLVQRHHVLRSLFKPMAGQPVLELAPSLNMDLPLQIDVNADSETSNKPPHILAAQEATNVQFDLEFGPLFYVKLLALSADENLLLVTAHQSIFDEASLQIFIAELATHYNALAAGEPSPLGALPLQYTEFAAWQRSQTWAEQVAYWKNKLAEAPLVLELPTDKARPPVQTLNARSVHFELPAELSQAVEQFSQAAEIPLFTALLAAFNALLHRYTGREDLLVGTPIDNRPEPELRELIGTFASTLVLRTNLADDPSFRELVGRQDEVVAGAFAQAQLPFEALLNQLRPDRDMSRAPLVQVNFAYQGEVPPLPVFEGLDIERLAVDGRYSQYDLELTLWREEGLLKGKLTYATDLFDRPTIERMAGHYQTLLAGAVQNPDLALHELPLLTEGETEQILLEWNSTAKEYGDMLPVYRLFEKQVEKRPNAVAALYDGNQVTYADLNRRANRLAHFLVEQGVGQEKIVALLANRSIDYLTSMLAIHKAGGAFLPLDPRHPSARLAQILTQSEAILLLTESVFAKVADEALAQMEAPPTSFYIQTALSQNHAEDNLPQTPALDSLAYIMFTSGSTGLPKGVMVEHLGMINHNYAKIGDTGMTENDILAQNGPQSFDIMVWQFVSPLIVGAKVCIFKDEIAYNPPVLYHHIQKEKITILQIVPSLLTPIIQEAIAQGQPLELPHLRWVVPTGEALPTELCRQWLKVYPHIPLLNTYGATECSDDQCHYPVREVAPDYRLPIMTIGTPIPNMRFYVLDKWLQPVPIGVVGELYVGGIGVGRGYLKDAEKTAKAFIPDPFVEGMRLYRTGDQGRFMPDGTVEFLGRVDHMVKVRGYRIELGEIESVLSQHPAVRQAVVIVREDTPNQKRLVGYVVCDPAQTPTGTDLRDYVSEKLPEYMVPSAVVVMDALPLTGNQKVDRKALPAPDLAKQMADAYVAPRSNAEKKLCKIWEEVLGLPQVGIRDNFFELGGYSLLAIRIFSQVERQFDKQLPLGTLFQAPTIEQLAQILQDESGEQVWSPLVTIQGKGSKPPFFFVSGGVLPMRNISQHLGLKQPFYALLTEALDGTKIMKAQIDLIAEDLIQELRKVQPHGPYYLGGAYGSGMVALEIARQLKKQGESIAMLVAFSTLPMRRTTSAAEGGSSAPAPSSSFYTKVGRKMRKLVRLNPMRMTTAEVDWFQDNAMDGFFRVAYKFYKTLGRPMPRYLRRGEYAEMLLRRAVSSYYPDEPYDGNLTVYITAEWTDSYPTDEQHGWSDYLTPQSRVEVHLVPGDPCTMFTEPNAYVVAQQLRHVLDKAQSKHRQTTP